jgi:hypothetical protein
LLAGFSDFCDPQKEAAMSNQSDWRFCTHCHELFFDDKKSVLGKCAGNPGKGHQPQGDMFFIPADVVGAITPNSQDQWRFCTACNAMFFNDNKPPLGHCPGSSDGHHPQGKNFFLPFNVPPTPTAQDSWRFCGACHSLFFDDKKGTCVANPSGHIPLGNNFVLPHDIPNDLEFDFPSITFPGGTPVGGRMHLKIDSSGTFNFTGHFHDSGAIPENVTTALTVKDSQNRLYLFSASGHMGGTIGGDRNFDIANGAGRNQAIADFWVSLAAGASAREHTRVNVDIKTMIGVVKQAVGVVVQVIQVVGPIILAI